MNSSRKRGELAELVEREENTRQERSLAWTQRTRALRGNACVTWRTALTPESYMACFSNSLLFSPCRPPHAPSAAASSLDAVNKQAREHMSMPQPIAKDGKQSGLQRMPDRRNQVRGTDVPHCGPAAITIWVSGLGALGYELSRRTLLACGRVAPHAAPDSRRGGVRLAGEACCELVCVRAARRRAVRGGASRGALAGIALRASSVRTPRPTIERAMICSAMIGAACEAGASA